MRDVFVGTERMGLGDACHSYISHLRFLSELALLGFGVHFHLTRAYSATYIRQRHARLYDNVYIEVKGGALADIFAARLRTARERRQLSQSELADKAGLLPSAISHFETGRRSPSFANLKALSDALRVTTDYLIGRSDSMDMSNAAATKLLRHAQKMSDEDLERITQMAEVMVRKQKKE